MSERKFAFIGSQEFADFFHIGGMESYTRRLGIELARHGYRIEYLVYGLDRENELTPAQGIRVKYFRSLRDVLSEVSHGDFSHMIRVWMDKSDRVQYLRWLLSTSNRGLRIYHLWFCVPDSLLKRLLTYLEFTALSYQGYTLCVSPRQLRLLKPLGKRVHFLLPPVPEEFFLKPEEKAFEWPIRVTFLGVLHPDKGIKEAIRLFTALRNDSRFRFTIYATYDPHSAHQRQIHEWLLRQDGLIYVPMERNICWTPELEQRVQSVLAETDIFIQPFRSLQNTVDTPLLVLEAMASLCIVLTTPIGSISEIYGKSPFIIPYQHFVEKAIALLKGIDEDRLLKERLRIYRRNEEVRFSQPEIARKFLTRLKEEGEL